MRWILAALYSAAGIAHLVVPESLLAITPPWVPFAPQVILITGRNKDSIVDHFDYAFELETTLRARGRSRMPRAGS
jgi:hypothetical protein